MILSKYRNPPYRTPITSSTPIRTSSGSPPATAAVVAESLTSTPHASVSQHMSPSKRKRCELEADFSAAPTSALLPARMHRPLDEEIPPQGAESPRSKVAERLRGLELSSSAPVSLDSHAYASEESDGERRKVRRTGPLNSSSSAGNHDIDTDNTTPASSPKPAYPSLLSAPFHPSAAKRVSLARNTPHSSRPKRRLSSPPPPVDPAMIFLDDSNPNAKNDEHAKTTLETSNVAAVATSEDATPATAQLTWQPAEITGHRLDARNPDDDGEGINGLGFRPTAAIAHVRSQRRKQQVSEWKAREAREARQRRFERRRGVSPAVSLRGAELEMARGRVVRFAGVS